jgi:transcriptional regulator GlxA family with amidase domain
LRDGDWHRASLAYILFGLWAAYSKGEEVVVGGAVHPAVEQAARLLRDINPPPAVPELARKVGLSPSRLSRLFAAQTGLSLTSFRAAQCLSRALRLCDDSNLPLSEIALRAGFGSYAQFHRVFREQTGQSPAQYRQQNARLQTR